MGLKCKTFVNKSPGLGFDLGVLGDSIFQSHERPLQQVTVLVIKFPQRGCDGVQRVDL